MGRIGWTEKPWNTILFYDVEIQSSFLSVFVFNNLIKFFCRLLMDLPARLGEAKRKKAEPKLTQKKEIF
jgi:hypothetical protein